MKKGAISTEMWVTGIGLLLAIVLGWALYNYVAGTQGPNFIELLGSLGSEVANAVSSWFTPKFLT
jgi:hypothetical protein